MNTVFHQIVCTVCAFMSVLPIAASRVVDNPWINFASKSAFDISRVELTDTATILHFITRGFPTTNLRINSDPVVKAEGKTFRLKHASGITPGEDCPFPENGMMEFTLSFEAMPEDTQMFDFVSDYGLWLRGIDLSGKPQPAFPEGVPHEVRTYSADGPMPEPSFTIGETTLTFHLRPYLPEFSKGYMLGIDYPDGRQEHFQLNFDREGNATVRFMQYGSCQAGVADMSNGGIGYAFFTVFPGETADCWLDTRLSGVNAMSYRGDVYRNFSRTLHTGYYGDFDRMRERTPGFGMGVYAEDFADYHMTGQEYLCYVKDLYTSYTDSIASSNLRPMEKEYLNLSLQNEALTAIANYREILSDKYKVDKNDPLCEVPEDSVPARLWPDDYKEVTGWFDISNPKLLMDPIFGQAVGMIDWNAYGAPGDLSKSLGMVRRMIKKARERTLKPVDVDSLRSLSNPFFHTLGDSIFSMMANEIQLVKDNSPIFDSIVSPHRGKVVVVDLWNTWCAPCRRALKINEPLKDAELSAEDIVWIYIADESSDPDEYEQLKSGIKGIHYRLDRYQMDAIYDRFRVEGIPYYIIVDREGNEEGRPDLRDHELYVREIKSKLEQ